MCLYEAQISGERLQDHWSSGLLLFSKAYDQSLVYAVTSFIIRGKC